LAWNKLTQAGVTDEACRYMVDLLVLADNYHCEAALGRRVLSALEQGKKASIHSCRERFGSQTEIPAILCQQHSLSSYDQLMGGT
jgi:hypothetical protein